MKQAWKGRATAMRFRNEVQMPTSLSAGYQNGTWDSNTSSIRSTRQFRWVWERGKRREHWCVE